MLDLCTKRYCTSVLLSAKTQAKNNRYWNTGTRYCRNGKQEVKYNSLEEKIDIINDDIANALKYIKHSSVDTVSVNPPYMKDTTAIKNPDYRCYCKA